MKSQPLLVHLLFHPESAPTRALACHVHRQLNGDLIVPGLRVPTVFCPREKGDLPPSELRLDFAERNFVVVLADDRLNIDEAWCRFAADVREQAQPPGARFVPIQLDGNAWPLDPRLSDLSFAKAFLKPEGPTRDAFVVRRIVVELCRYLSDLEGVAKSEFEAPITLFLSHTKADIDREPRVTRSFIEALDGQQPIENWVDSGDIATGSKFAEAIERGVQRSSLLAVLTDTYATREWCREEILLAKEHQRPVAVIDALSSHEVRSFPYLGNVPRLRWDGDPQKGIDLLLKETLRHLHDLARLEQCQQPGDYVFARPPELATLVGVDPKGEVLYPDPPVGVGEAKRLAKAGIKVTTPFQRLATARSLHGQPIALSMSESTDIAECGHDALHLESCMLDLSRYLLLKGATLAYGGHLGADGYTQKLFELVRTHNSVEGAHPFDRVVNHRGWPLPRLSVKERSALNQVSKTIELPRPADIDETLHPDFTPEPKFFHADKSPEHRFAWARGMTEMRAYQADRARSGVVARIVIGGTFGPTTKVLDDGTRKEQWYASRIPGVLEEIVLSAQTGQPVFLIGAFGGVARLVIDLLRGSAREEATWDYQKRAPFAAEMNALYHERGLPWLDYPEMIALLREKGPVGINPLLTPTEQAELFETVDQGRMIGSSCSDSGGFNDLPHRDMKIFFSYPSTAHPIVDNIYRHLPQGAFNAFLDTERITAGAAIADELDQNIRDSEYFVSFLSAEAMASDWVRRELKHALAREETTGRSFIVPVLLNDFSREQLPDELKDRRFLTYKGTNYPRQIAAFANELADELLRLACERPPLRCEGMAAVYFFSFVEPFLKKFFAAQDLSLQWNKGEGRLQKPRLTELRVLLPEILDEYNLTELLRRPNLRQGALLDGTEIIFRQVLFDRTIEDQPEAGVVFYDVPNILNSAAKLFAQERSDQLWEKRNRIEVLAFKYNLERLADKNITKRQLRAALKVEVIE